MNLEFPNIVLNYYNYYFLFSWSHIGIPKKNSNIPTSFDVLLTVYLSIILVINQLSAKIIVL